VENSCPGTSRTFAQSLHFAHQVSTPYEKPIAIGTDMLLNRTPGPRFGPRTAQGTVGEPAALGPSAERHAQATRQRNAVVYRGALQGKPRFAKFVDTDVAYLPPSPGVTPPDHQSFAVAIWNALWLHETGGSADGYDDDTHHILAGFNTPAGAGLDSLDPDGRIAHTARHAPASLDQSNWKAAVLAASIATFDHRGDGGNAGSPLTRCVAGTYGFDYNFDGFAHYGLLPDLLQDLTNIGLAPNIMNDLFNSAEAYLRIWETCRAHSRQARRVVETDLTKVNVAALEAH
jgi:hypothetical protein